MRLVPDRPDRFPARKRTTETRVSCASDSEAEMSELAYASCMTHASMLERIFIYFYALLIFLERI